MLTIVDYWDVRLGGLRYRRAILDGLADEEGVLGEFDRDFGQAMDHKALEWSHRPVDSELNAAMD